MNVSGERTKSLWTSIEVDPGAPRLKSKLRCETAVVGSGIAGLSTAFTLANEGQKVVVVDRGPIAGGMTARTTAHLAPICDDALSALIKLRGEETARLFQQSQEAAAASIEANIKELGINCDFRRLDGFLFPSLDMEKKEAREECDKEYEAAKKAGAAVERVKGVPLKGFEDMPALRYPNQATFHPLKYLKALAAAIKERGGKIFAESPVTQIDELQDGVRISVEGGGTINAARAVVATNSPINDRVALHSKMAPYRTYAMAFKLPKAALPDALYWDMADPYHYVRLHPGRGEEDYLIAGGADHKSGEADDGVVRFEAIEAWMRALLPKLGNETHRWSGQVMDTMDYCAFMGRNPGNTNIFVVTGDSGQGITHGALAGILLKDLIINGSSPWEDVYEPSRKTPTGALNYVRENVTAIKNFAEYVLPGDLDTVEELKSGEGGIIRSGLSMIAACRDLQGKLHLNSASCTHLGCMVHWNSIEQCWDCPCHGSQFAPDGSVLNGPAVSPLKAAEIAATKAKIGAKR